MTSITETYTLKDVRALKGVFLADAVKAFLPKGSGKLTADEKREALADMWAAETDQKHKDRKSARLASDWQADQESIIAEENAVPDLNDEVETLLSESDAETLSSPEYREWISTPQLPYVFRMSDVKRAMVYTKQRNGGKLTHKQMRRWNKKRHFMPSANQCFVAINLPGMKNDVNRIGRTNSGEIIHL